MRGQSLWVLAAQLDIENINIGEALKQNVFALHDRFAGSRPQISLSQNRRSIGYDGYQVGFGSVFVNEIRVAMYFKAWRGNSWRVGKAELTLGQDGLVELTDIFPAGILE